MARARRHRKAELGARLREVRTKRSWSLRDVERQSGLNNGYLSQLEQGKIVHPSPSVLRKLEDGYEVPFPVLLGWAGYLDSDELDVTPNQAIAMSTIGDPSDEELRVIQAFVELMRSEGKALYRTLDVSDRVLEEVEIAELRRNVVALLREADALGKRPTPLSAIREAADLVKSGELTLTPADRRRLVGGLGRWVERAWARLQGALDFRTRTIWVKPDLHPMKERFVISHEIAHAILPAHRETFIDDRYRLPPLATAHFEREANQAAVEILFQAGELTEEVDSGPLLLSRICELSRAFGGSIVAAARYVAETSRRDIAVAIAHESYDDLGPTHLYVSLAFEKRFAWRRGRAPLQRLRALLYAARQGPLEDVAVGADIRERPTLFRLEAMNTCYSSIVLVVPESRTRSTARLLAPGGADVADMA